MGILSLKNLFQTSRFAVQLRQVYSTCTMTTSKNRVIPLPVPGERNILITSALPYVNNEPHLGNIIGCVLSADAFSRYARLRGYNTIYICGTDEYGTATETKALEEGISCQELCDKYYALHKSIYEHFEIDFDYFGRTTTPKQTEIAQDIFLKLNEKNYLKKASMVQLYCNKCQRFLSDRFVEGICPHCNFPDARGDQCDGCQKLLNSVDLIHPRCKTDGGSPIQRDSTHLFLDLPELQPQLKDFIQSRSEEGKWSSNAIAVTNSWLKEGLKPRCITRDLVWGTPVPLKEFEKKVFYVWFDAPIGYPSITANLTPCWEQWWKNPDHVQLYQFMGKDNTPFHTIIFPSSLIGTGDNWTLLHHVNTTEYLNYEGDKFSKSRKTGVFGSHVKEIGIPISVWRYYLFINRPESSDSDFQWKDFIDRNNCELLNNLGNFVNRVMKFVCTPKYNSRIPEFKFGHAPEDQVFISEVNELLKQLIDAMENIKLRLGLQLVMAISSRGNQYLQDNKLDSNLYQTAPERCNSVVGHALNLVALLAPLINPYMPSTSLQIASQLNSDVGIYPLKFQQRLYPEHQVNKPQYLFTKLDETLSAILREKYSGTKAENKAKNNGTTISKRKARSSDPIALFSKLPKEKITPELEKKHNQVQAQSSKVKQLKSNNGGKEEIELEVQTLLSFKNELLKEIDLISGISSQT